MAVDSVRANRVRASLTILGVAIGTTVVIAMASTLTGIHRTVTSIIERAGPKTLFVVRFFREGGDVRNLKWLAGRADGQVVQEDF